MQCLPSGSAVVGKKQREITMIHPNPFITNFGDLKTDANYTHTFHIYSEKYEFSLAAICIATSYSNSAVNEQMNKCMTVPTVS